MNTKRIYGIISVIVLIVVAVYLLPLFMPTHLPDWWTQKRLNLGLDLQGGMQMLLDVDLSKVDPQDHENTVNTALEIIRNRIDPEGVKEPTITREGKKRIIVQLPGTKDFERNKRLIESTAMLEFKLVAQADQQGKVLEKLDTYLKEHIEEPKYADLKHYAEEMGGKFESASMIDAEKDTIEVDYYSSIFSDLTSADGGSWRLSHQNYDMYKKLLNDQNFVRQIPAGLQLVLGKKSKDSMLATRTIYVLESGAKLNGNYLQSARAERGSGGGIVQSRAPHIAFEFNKKGAKIFEDLTGKNTGRYLAIELDEAVYSAPVIKDKIRGGKGVIEGSFSMAEAQDLANILNAGILPAPVIPAQIQSVGATLGEDSIKAGLNAGIWGMAVVILFMLVYYKVGGFIADLALIVNLGFILSVLTMIGGTLTLPGIAGMILTIGMAVDANVLIFERIREELDANKTPNTAIRDGFDRAYITILDANITTLITAIVLYQFGTGPIKGFAVTLSLGIIGSLFSSLIFSRTLFNYFVISPTRKRLSI